MSSASTQPEHLKAQERPKAGRSQGSWIDRLHRQHHKSKHSREEAESEPLLQEPDDEYDDDAERQAPPPKRTCQPDLDRFKTWTKKTGDAIAKNWRYAALACVFAGVTLIGSIVVVDVVQRAKHPQVHDDNVCLTPACVHAASEILYNLDPNYEKLDPCEDFDQYVCGGWRNRHDMRPDQSSTFTGTYMNEASQTTLRHILESSDVTVLDTNKDNFAKLKAGYDACIDEATIKSIGLKPLKELVDEIKQKYSIKDESYRHSPLVSSQDQKPIGKAPESELSDVIKYLAAIGVDAIISMDVRADDRDPDNNALFISSPFSPGLPSIEYYDDEDIVKQYKEVATAVLGAFVEVSNDTASVLVSRSSAKFEDIDSLVKSMVEFESKLAKFTPPTADQEDITKSYNPASLDETQKLLPQISFQKIISSLSPSGKVPDRVILGSPAYLKNASSILDDTPKEVVQAFLVWKSIQAYSSKIMDPAVKPLHEFENVLRGQDPDATPERWKTCIRAVDGQLGWILSKYFIDAAFSQESKEFGDLIVHDIKDSFENTLKDIPWMSPDVRELAISKVHQIDQKIGYPETNPNIRNPKALQDYYSGLEVSNSSFFGNSLNSTIFQVEQVWEKLGKPVRKDEWGMTAPTVNAYYNPPGNEIVFPAGIMQPPLFFEPSVPQYLSYGAFGSISGHELSHAFDSLGRHYDQNGNYTDWWDSNTVKAFEEKAQCFVDQYAEYTVPGRNGEELHVNGRLTLGENIADSGGIAASFAAWKRRDEANPNQLLPGLGKFTKEQLFFVSYGTFFCGKIRKEKAIERIYTDPHSPDWARTLGAMNNTKQFKEAFKCKVKEPTCKLW